MRPIVLIVSLSVWLAAPSLAQDPSAEVERAAKVAVLLDSIHDVPSAQEWTTLGPGAAAVLRAIAADSSQLATRRGRAATALRHFPDADTRSLHERLVADTSAPSVVRRKAALALALSAGELAVPALQPLLQSDDKRLREGVVKALGRIRSPAAVSALQASLDSEPKPYLKEEIRKAIARSGGR
jgi:HEAT repeat protein